MNDLLAFLVRRRVVNVHYLSVQCRWLIAWLCFAPLLVTSLATDLGADLTTDNDNNTLEIVNVEVSPQTLELSGERGAAQLLVTGYDRQGAAIDLTHIATFSPSEIVQIELGYAQSRQDGADTIDVRYGDALTTLAIRVTDSSQARPISFRWETLAILTKQGCNSGSCHGKPNGRGALELSLNAFDPSLDQRNLVRGSFVRFTEPLVPAQSLLLKKPTLQIPHGGGKRLREDDLAYDILRQWIFEGCQTNSEAAPTAVLVRVEPARRVVHLNETGEQQLRVLVDFSDGSVRDVTRIATYSLSNAAIASVDRKGRVTGKQRGQTAVVVRYLDDIVSAQLTVVEDVPNFAWQPQAERNYVDKHVHQKLRQLQYLPSDICDDATFLRRLSLDVRGLLPTAQEANHFLADKATDKRETMIDRLLDSPEYARFWGLRMADLLRINRESLSPARAAAYSDWVFQSIANNQPYDQFVSSLLTAQGLTSEVQPANFFRVTSDTKQVSETVAQVFMGSRIMCAQCHNHPYESWTQDNYYQIGSAFHEVDREILTEQEEADGKKNGRKRKKKDKDKTLPAPERDVAVSLTAGRVMSNPRTGIEQQPWPTDVTRSADEDKRVAFARWLTSADNRFFARVAVNRIWSQLMGRGIVEPIDDFRSSNPPVNAELLNTLAADFVDSGFDRKHIIRTILNSRTYQRSVDTNSWNESENQLFSHARVRLLSAEGIQDAITRLCEGDTSFERLEQEVHRTQAKLDREDTDDTTRESLQKQLKEARQRRDSHFMTQQPYPHLTTFLKAFGQPERKTACACERREEVSLAQALQLMNSKLVRQQATRARERFDGLADDELVEQLYLAAFGRRPRTTERETVRQHLESSADRGQAIEDLVWAMINTNEFLFQH